MSLSKQHAMIAIMFLVPVFCCFVGAGAFIHVVVAVEEQDRRKEVQQRHERLREIENCQQQLHALAEKAKKLKQMIAEVAQRIRELSEKLLQTKQDSETAEKIEEDIAEQRALMARLIAEASRLAEEITQNQREIEGLRNQTGNVDLLDKQLKDLQQRLDELNKQVEKARKENSRLFGDKQKLQREHDEQKNTFQILPRRPSWGAAEPIYLECTADGVTIQPEGTQLATQPTDDDRSRFLAVARRKGHVVFLIRPDGLFSFYQYRGVLTDAPHVRAGWEPVNASWNLIYPN